MRAIFGIRSFYHPHTALVLPVSEIVGGSMESGYSQQTISDGCVPAAIESMPLFDHADTTLASGSPFLAGAKPTLLLLVFALRALGGAVGDADALDTLGFRGRLVLGRVEAGIRRHQVRRAAQRCVMRFDRATDLGARTRRDWDYRLGCLAMTR
jgi:hypothetical protein